MDKPTNRFSLSVYRGGRTPQNEEDWERWTGRFGKHEMPVLYAHTDRDLVAQEYATPEYAGTTKVQEFQIDPTKFLDARTPEGLAKWNELKHDERRAAAAGYSGAIYPDPHDWKTGGHEVAIWDSSHALLPGEEVASPPFPGAPKAEPLLRESMTYGRSGRPIQTKPLPIGTEPQILERAEQRLSEGPRVVGSKAEQQTILRKNWQQFGKEMDFDDVWEHHPAAWDNEVEAWNKSHPDKPMPGPDERYTFGTVPEFEHMFENKYLKDKNGEYLRAPFPGAKAANEYFEGDPETMRHTVYTSPRQIPEEYRPSKMQAMARKPASESAPALGIYHYQDKDIPQGRARGGRIIGAKTQSEVGLVQNVAGTTFRCGTCKYFNRGVCHNDNPELKERKVKPHWCCNLYDHPGMKLIA